MTTDTDTDVAAVCFDLDDTLYPYAEYARTGLCEAADHLADRTGLHLSDELLELYFDEDVTEGTFDRLLDRHGLSREWVPDLVEAYHDASEPLPPYPDVPLVLSELEDEYHLGVITDGRNGRAKLRRLGLDHHFDAVLVTPTVDLSKHDPEPFERVLSQFDVPPGRAVYVGDDPRVDFRVPNRLGMSTIRVRRGRYADLEPGDPDGTPDFEFRRLDELFALVREGDASDCLPRRHTDSD